MSATGSFSPAGKKDERRLDARLRASSIIYAQLGNDNGGIVVNLGTGGVSFQAARRLTEEIGAPLQLKLRGSGLNLVVPGALTWLGPTQKEAGIRFNSLPPEFRVEIEKWIARETGAPEPAAAAPFTARPAAVMPSSAMPPPAAAAPLAPILPTPAMPPVPLPADRTDRTIARLSAAIAMAQAAVDHVSLGATAAPAAPLAGKTQPGTSLPSTPHAAATVLPSDPAAAIAPESLPAASGAPTENAAAAPQADAAVEVPSLDHFVFERFLRDQQLVGIGSASAVQPETELSDVSVAASAPALSAPQDSPAAVVKTPSEPFTAKVETPPPATAPTVRAPGKRVVRYVKPRPRPSLEEQLRMLVARWQSAGMKQKMLIGGSAAGALVLLLVLAFAGSNGGSAQLPQREAIVTPSARFVASGGTTNSAGAHPAAVTASSAPATSSAGRGASAPAVAAPPDGVPSSTTAAMQTGAGSSSSPQVPETDASPSLLTKWTDELFSVDPDGPKITEAQVQAQVWTSQSSGYYYCTDTEYYKSVQPGAFMQQGDALQHGYRPRLHRFCN